MMILYITTFLCFLLFRTVFAVSTGLNLAPLEEAVGSKGSTIQNSIKEVRIIRLGPARTPKQALNYEFPDQFSSVSEIIAYQGKEVDVLVKSPAFLKFTDDVKSLQELLGELRKQRGLTAWTKHEEHLRDRLDDLWLFKVLKNDKIAGTASFRDWLNGALKNDKVSDSGLFREYLKDWENSQRLWLSLKDSKAPLDTIEFIKSIAEKRFKDHLKQVKRVDDIAYIVKQFHDLETLNALQSSKQYKDIIHDPFKAFQLIEKLRYGNIKDQAPSFFENLQSASNRGYASLDEVRATLKNMETHGEDTFYKLNHFKPYIEYISDPGRAMNLLKDRISSVVRYSKKSYQILKAAAYRDWFPKPGASAKEIAHSYKKLLSVGAHENFQNDKTYLSFIDQGTIFKIDLLNEMANIEIPRDDYFFKQLEYFTIDGGLRDMVHDRNREAVEPFLLSKKRVKSVYQMASAESAGLSFVRTLQSVYPEFAIKLKTAAVA